MIDGEKMVKTIEVGNKQRMQNVLSAIACSEHLYCAFGMDAHYIPETETLVVFPGDSKLSDGEIVGHISAVTRANPTKRSAMTSRFTRAYYNGGFNVLVNRKHPAGAGK